MSEDAASSQLRVGSTGTVQRLDSCGHLRVKANSSYSTDVRRAAGGDRFSGT